MTPITADELMGTPKRLPPALPSVVHFLDKASDVKPCKKLRELTRAEQAKSVLEAITQAGRFVHASEVCETLGMSARQFGGLCRGLSKRGKIVVIDWFQHYQLWGLPSFERPEHKVVEERQREYRLKWR